MSDSLWPHGLKNTRPPCSSPTSWVYSNSCPLSQWSHPTISSSVVPFSSHLQSFSAKVHLVKAMVFPVVMYGCECWTIKVKHKRIDALELWCWRRLLRVPWSARRQSILKEINPECSLEGLMLKLKLQYFDHLMWGPRLIGKDLNAGKDCRQEERRATEDEMVGWHHQLNGHEFE